MSDITESHENTFANKKLVADLLLSNVKESENYLAWITYAQLLAILTTAISVFYEDAELPFSNLTFKKCSLSFAFISNIMMAFGFAVHGYYIWRFFENRIHLNKWLSESFGEQTDIFLAYRGNSVHEALFNNLSLSSVIPLFFLILLFSVEHALMVKNLTVFNENWIFVLNAVVVGAMVFFCYWTYFKRLNSLIKANKQNRRVRKIYKTERKTIIYLICGNIVCSFCFSLYLLKMEKNKGANELPPYEKDKINISYKINIASPYE